MEAPPGWANESLRAVRGHLDQNVFAMPAALVLVCLLVGSALLLIARRSAGALSEPLSAGSLILVGICVATAVVGSRYLKGRVALPEGRAFGYLLQWGPTCAVAMFVVALAIEGTSMPAMAIYLVLIVGAELLAERGAWIVKKSRASAGDLQSRQMARPTSDFHQQADRSRFVEPLAAAAETSSAVVEESPEIQTSVPAWEVPGDAEPLDELPEAMLEGAWQQVTRARMPEGEVITGWVKADFQPGERTAVLHVAFCPPLEASPAVELEQLSGPAARIKAAQVLPQGARLEIRLNAPAAEPESLMVAFVATRP